ncbi:MAG TPA: 2-amino-4-hydroxy-6-hydroxymethyldihydropteridine diphosphokinase [Chiayiivirga sp.]|nr:2-amino-4-hydroxy-6-hydroxymethyldihydropteridine diphosphokinase [Chiayiivirga sp.]
MSVALLSLGSNIEPERWLLAAAKALREQFPEIRFSPVLRYASVGFQGPDFLNAAAMLETQWEPQVLSDWLHEVEDAHGRQRDVPKFSSRTLDIDLVFYGDRICTGPGTLRLPRAEIKHAFVLEPMAMLAPDFVDPLSGKALATLWAEHPDQARPAPIVSLSV